MPTDATGPAPEVSGFIPDWRHPDDLPPGFNDLSEGEASRLMAERVRLLHVYGAPRWHSDVRIVGNRNALTVLRDAIDSALRDGNAETSVMANDGEGYGVAVEMDDHGWDHPSWETRGSHYVDPIASGRPSLDWMILPLCDALRRANAQLVKRGVRPIADPTQETSHAAE